MDDVIEVENYLDADWVRHVHLMSNTPIPNPSPIWGQGEVSREGGVWHFRRSWAAREAFAGTMRGSDRRERQVVVWALAGERVSVCIRAAANEFVRVFGRLPDFAAMREYPESLGFDVDVAFDGGAVALVECADVPRQFVMVF